MLLVTSLPAWSTLTAQLIACGVRARLGVSGLVITRVLPRGAAERAGLKPANFDARDLGDVITEVDGVAVRTIAQFAAELAKVGIGNRARLTVVNRGSTREVAVTVMDIS